MVQSLIYLRISNYHLIAKDQNQLKQIKGTTIIPSKFVQKTFNSARKNIFLANRINQRRKKYQFQTKCKVIDKSPNNVSIIYLP